MYPPFGGGLRGRKIYIFTPKQINRQIIKEYIKNKLIATTFRDCVKTLKIPPGHRSRFVGRGGLRGRTL